VDNQGREMVIGVWETAFEVKLKDIIIVWQSFYCCRGMFVGTASPPLLHRELLPGFGSSPYRGDRHTGLMSSSVMTIRRGSVMPVGRRFRGRAQCASLGG
jgi:hypothetical protein